MSQHDFHDRILPASPRRRRDARRQGHVWQSGELTTALALGGIGLLLGWQGSQLATACGAWLQQSLSRSPMLRTDQFTGAILSPSLLSLAGSAAAMLLGLWLIAVIVRLLQVGPLFVPELAKPRMDRVSPWAGLRRMFAPTTWVRGPLWGLKLAVIGGLVWWTITRDAGTFVRLTTLSRGELAVALGGIITTFVWRLCGGLLVVAAIDAAWQWRSHERQLRMSADEVRAERRDASRRDGVRASAPRRSEAC